MYPPLTPSVCSLWWPGRAHAGSGATTERPGDGEGAAAIPRVSARRREIPGLSPP